MAIRLSFFRELATPPPCFAAFETDHSRASPNDQAAVNPNGNLLTCLSGELQLRELERGLQLATIPYSGNLVISAEVIRQVTSISTAMLGIPAWCGGPSRLHPRQPNSG